MSFVEQRFLTRFRYGLRARPRHPVEIITVASGAEQRIRRSPSFRWDIEGEVTGDVAQTAEVMSAYNALGGPALGFRLWFPRDCSPAADGVSAPAASDQVLGVGDGETRGFQLVKRYSLGLATTIKPLRKPVEGSVRVAVDGVETSAFLADTTSGLVTFDSPPASGATLTAGCLYDLPVRFDDVATRSADNWNRDSVSFRLVELLEPGMITEEAFFGGARVVTIAETIPVHPGLARLWVVTPVADGLGVVLPDASTLQPGGPLLVVSNASGAYGLDIVDALGTTLLTLEAGASGTLWLAAAGAAGVWVVTPSGAVTAGNAAGWFAVACSDETTALEAGTAVATLRLPQAMALSEVRASLTTASGSGVVTVDVNANGTSLFGVQKLQIDQGETTSATASASPALATTLLATDDEITVDIDAAGSGATGLKVYLRGQAA